MFMFIIAIAGTLASADQYKTIKSESKTDKYEYAVSYPQLLPGSVPAYAAISAQIRSHITEGDCGGQPDQEGASYYYSAEATVVALNATYVGVAVRTNDYCGGAHPNNGTYYLTYDARNGAELSIEREFGFKHYNDPEYDFEKMEARRKLLAELLVERIPAGDAKECYEGTRAEKLETLSNFYPVVHGLAKNKTVVLGVQPPHVASVCAFEVRLNYAEIQHLLDRGSYLHRWLR